MKLFDSSYSQLPDLHDKYKLLNSYDGMFFREIIEQWAEGFQDRDGKILKEFQTSFHSTFWEFYIFQLLKDMGLKDNILRIDQILLLKMAIRINFILRQWLQI